MKRSGSDPEFTEAGKIAMSFVSKELELRVFPATHRLIPASRALINHAQLGKVISCVI